MIKNVSIKILLMERRDKLEKDRDRDDAAICRLLGKIAALESEIYDLDQEIRDLTDHAEGCTEAIDEINELLAEGES